MCALYVSSARPTGWRQRYECAHCMYHRHALLDGARGTNVRIVCIIGTRYWMAPEVRMCALYVSSARATGWRRRYECAHCMYHRHALLDSARGRNVRTVCIISTPCWMAPEVRMCALYVSSARPTGWRQRYECAHCMYHRHALLDGAGGTNVRTVCIIGTRFWIAPEVGMCALYVSSARPTGWRQRYECAHCMYHRHALLDSAGGRNVRNVCIIVTPYWMAPAW